LAFKFNIFTSNFDIVEGGGLTTWLPPVNTRADLPSGDSDGAARVVLDEDTAFVYDNAADEWHNLRLSEALFNAIANAQGISIDSVTTSGKVDYRVNVHPADSSNPGVVSTVAQNFAGDKTFDNNVTITGDLTVNGTTTSVNSQTLDVTDANITVNNNGDQAAADLNDAGITVEMSDATDAIIGYDSATTSKFRIGEVGSTSEIADVSSTQSFTNKNLKDASNLITGASADSLRRETGNQNLFSIPDSGSNDNFVLEAFAQTLQNKTIDNSNTVVLQDSLFTLQDNVDNTKQAQFRVDLVDTATTRMYNLPNADDEIVGKDVTQTLTNKTIDGDDNTLLDISITSLKTELADANKFIQRDGSGAVISGKDVPTGDVVGTTDTQTLTNKTIDADANTITNIENADIKASAAIDATKIADGSIDNTEFQSLDGITSNIQSQLDDRVVGPSSATDNAVPRFDSTTGKLLQNSGVFLNDLDEVSGVTQLDVDNLNFNGNDITATNVDGNISLVPNGTGHVTVNTSLIKEVTDPVDPQDAATRSFVESLTSFVPGDLDEVTFSLANNQTILADVTGVSFANGSVRSANIEYSIAIDATGDIFESGTIEAIQTNAGWLLSVTSTGNNTQVLFDINSSGQLQYTSANIPGFISGTLKARATVTSV